MTTESNEYDFKYHPGLLIASGCTMLQSKDAYEEFLFHHPELEDLTYIQWIKLIEALDSQDPSSPGLKFRPPANLGALGVSAATALAGKALNVGPDATIDDIVDGTMNFLRDQVRQRAAGVFINEDEGIQVPDDGDGGTSQENYSGGSNFNPTGLSLNLKPVDTNFVTGIVPLYRPKFFLDGTNSNAPLIIKVRNVFPEYTESSSPDLHGGNPDIQRYLENKIISNWVNTISVKVKLNSFNSPLINFKHIMNYYRILSYSLAVLYFFRSVDAHFRMDGNRNDAMIALYKSLSAEDIRQVGILAQIIDEIPLDPMLNEFMFHFYDNYKQSHLPGSPLLKFSPVPFNDTTDNNFNSISAGQAIQCINMLKSKPFRDFQSVLVQAFPDSVKQKTYSYSGVPKFDANWLTCFTNQVYVVGDMVGTVPQVADQVTPVIHNLHTDAPDGWIEASNNIFNSTTQRYEAGFGGPKFISLENVTDEYPVTYTIWVNYVNSGVNGITDSFIYTTDINNAGQSIQSFWPLEHRERFQILSGNTYKYFTGSTGVKSFQRFGAELAIPRTIRDSVPVCNQFSDFMYSPSNFMGSSKSSTSYTDDMDGETTKPRRRRRKSKK